MIPPRPGAHLHLIGVGGTAMGALAGLLRETGYRLPVQMPKSVVEPGVFRPDKWSDY